PAEVDPVHAGFGLRRAGDDEGGLCPRREARLPLLFLRRRVPAIPGQLIRGESMQYIRTASFGGLFTTTFLVAASFQIAFSLLGVVLAVLSPGLFNMNGVPATSPVGAIGVLIFLLCF